jgi:hypothetical protein
MVFTQRSHRPPRATPRRVGRDAIVWALASFGGLQFLLCMTIDVWEPALRDPEFARKLALLRQRLAESNGEGLVVALGTSRTAFGICGGLTKHPEVDEDRPRLVFNYGVVGGGPLYELVFLRRLLSDGICPELILIEVHPPLLNAVDGLRVALSPDAIRCDAGDLRVQLRHVDRPGPLALQWLRLRLAPCHWYRHAMLSRAAPSWVTADPELAMQGFNRPDGFGWAASPWGLPTDTERRRRSVWTFDAYAPAVANFAVSREADGALREMLEVCDRAGIGAALILMPEESTYRRLFSQRTKERTETYLDQLCAEFRVPLIDARGWCDDEDFCDGQHLVAAGAERFTAQLDTRTLRPILTARRVGPEATFARQPRPTMAPARVTR